MHSSQLFRQQFTLSANLTHFSALEHHITNIHCDWLKRDISTYCVFHISFIFTNRIGSTSKDQATQSLTMLLRLSHILHNSRHGYTVIFDARKLKSNTRNTLLFFNWWKMKIPLLIVSCRCLDRRTHVTIRFEILPEFAECRMKSPEYSYYALRLVG